MKKTDLEKNKGLKINSAVKRFGTPGRYGKARQTGMNELVAALLKKGLEGEVSAQGQRAP